MALFGIFGRNKRPARLALLMPWGRVGSNLIFSLLRDSFAGSEVRLANEPLNRIADARAQADWFRDFYAAAGDERLIASKHGYRAFADPAALAPLFGELDIAVARLRRANFVKVAVSQLRAELYAAETEKRHGRALWGVRKGDEPLPPVALDPGRFVEVLGAVTSSDAALRQFAPAARVFDLEYESLRADPQRALDDLLGWLGVEPGRRADVRFDKATPDDLASAVPNLDALRHAVREAGFAELDPMFDA